MKYDASIVGEEVLSGEKKGNINRRSSYFPLSCKSK